MKELKLNEALWKISSEHCVVEEGYKTYEEAFRKLAKECINSLSHNPHHIEELGYDREIILDIMETLEKSESIAGIEAFLELHPGLNINKERVEEQKSSGELLRGQAKIQREMQQEGFNVVTCGNCGTVLLHKADETGAIECHNCLKTMDLSDCSDLYY